MTERIGICGGLATGKTTLAKLLGRKGYARQASNSDAEKLLLTSPILPDIIATHVGDTSNGTFYHFA